MWVLGGVCRETLVLTACVLLYFLLLIFRKEVFLVVCPDNKRDKQTLLTIINDKVHNVEDSLIVIFSLKFIILKVEKGTRILTDGWQAYKSLPQEGYSWDWVNHSENFLKPGTKDVHTNEIEGINY